MKHYLAPIPAVHAAAAKATFDEFGAVALGSNQLDLFGKLKGARVWIAASTGYVPERGVRGVDIGKVILVGSIRDTVMGDARGRHPDPALRPATTEGDTAWTFFYDVVDLETVEPPLATAGLKRAGGGRVEVAPHFLIAIDPPSRPLPS